MGNELVIYWRELSANETIALPLNLIATVPGSYKAPASRTYLYYTDEIKHWVAGHEVSVSAL